MNHSLTYFRLKLLGCIKVFPIFLLAIILHTIHYNFANQEVVMECEKIEFSEDAESSNKSDKKENNKEESLDDFLYGHSGISLYIENRWSTGLDAHALAWDTFLPTWTPPPEFA